MDRKILKIGLVCAGAIISIFLLLLIFGILLDYGVIKRKDAKPEVTVKYTPHSNLMGVDEESIADSEYHETLQEALYENGAVAEEGKEYRKNIDEVIKTFENEDYIAIFFRSVKNEKVECFTLAKFKKKLIDGKVKYVFLSGIPTVTTKNAWYIGGFEELIEDDLVTSDYMQGVNIAQEDTRFIYGICRFEEIYQLRVEGQEPTEIIPYEVFGKKEYFWYYEDLKSTKAGNQLEFTVD